ncbi:hypothetical protein ABEY65_28310 [Priestia aryabhattai]|uniref:hypothetical protein n=1 Tax=Priestia aryabhattai TaxID=412384 RepID=UPI003D2996EF
MAIEVHVPNKAYNGVLGGVHFRRGVGVFEDEARGKVIAEEFGFEIVEPTIAATGPVEEAEPVEEKPKRKPRKKKAVSKEAE